MKTWKPPPNDSQHVHEFKPLQTMNGMRKKNRSKGSLVRSINRFFLFLPKLNAAHLHMSFNRRGEDGKLHSAISHRCKASKREAKELIDEGAKKVE